MSDEELLENRYNRFRQFGYFTRTVDDDEYEEWVSRQGKNRYILTLIGRSLSASQIEAATEVIASQGLNIDSILRLTGRQSIKHPERNVRACIEFSLRGTPDRGKMQAQLMKLSTESEGMYSTVMLTYLQSFLTLEKYAAIAALNGSQDSVTEMVKGYQRRRDILVEGINKIPGCYCPMPKGAFYTVIDLPVPENEIRDALLKIC